MGEEIMKINTAIEKNVLFVHFESTGQFKKQSFNLITNASNIIIQLFR